MSRYNLRSRSRSTVGRQTLRNVSHDSEKNHGPGHVQVEEMPEKYIKTSRQTRTRTKKTRLKGKYYWWKNDRKFKTKTKKLGGKKLLPLFLLSMYIVVVIFVYVDILIQISAC